MDSFPRVDSREDLSHIADRPRRLDSPRLDSPRGSDGGTRSRSGSGADSGEQWGNLVRTRSSSTAPIDSPRLLNATRSRSGSQASDNGESGTRSRSGSHADNTPTASRSRSNSRANEDEPGVRAPTASRSRSNSRTTEEEGRPRSESRTEPAVTEGVEPASRSRSGSLTTEQATETEPKVETPRVRHGTGGGGFTHDFAKVGSWARRFSKDVNSNNVTIVEMLIDEAIASSLLKVTHEGIQIDPMMFKLIDLYQVLTRL